METRQGSSLNRPEPVSTSREALSRAEDRPLTTWQAAFWRSSSMIRLVFSSTSRSRFSVCSRRARFMVKRSRARSSETSRTSLLIGLVMKSEASNLSDSMARSRSPWPVIMTTSVSGDRCLIRLSSSMPSMTGILMSVKTMPGRNESKTSRASWPLAAVSTS